MTWILQLFTGKDNKTLDIGRVHWFAMTAGYLGLSGWHVYSTGAFDAVPWATGAAAVLASGGAALGLKANTEPGGAS